MVYNLPNNYSSAFHTLTELQFDSRQLIEQYLSMNEAFSGQPLRLTSDASLANTCQFNLTASRRRRLEESQSPLRTVFCPWNQSVLIYFNGIGYSPSAAIENVRKIQQILGYSSININGGVIALGAWRTDGMLGFLAGIVLAYQQFQQQNNEAVSDYVDLLSCMRMILNLCTSSLNLPQNITRQIYQQFRTFFVRKSFQSFLNFQSQYNTAKHAEFIAQQLGEGKKVVLLAHAETTLYANLVYNRLTSAQKRSVSLVYIAPIASSMADGTTNYITNPNDYVIQGLRIIAQAGSFPAPLAANAVAATFSSDSYFGFNHDLLGYTAAYFQRLIDLIYAAKNRATQPSRTMGSGPITVSLTWDEQRDLDLHVFSPNYHVFYLNRSGQNGYLDIDDRDGYGPQHYYTRCPIQQGNYTVRVNYFYGNATSTSNAIVTVSAGSEYYVKSFSVYPPMGYFGNDLPPYFICSIMVSTDQILNEYVFKIIHD